MVRFPACMRIHSPSAASQPRHNTLAHMWEWAVSSGALNSACGVSMTPYEAMEALSRKLIEGHQSARGYVAPVTLADGAEASFYVRTLPTHVAVYDAGIVRWTLTNGINYEMTSGDRLSGDPESLREIDVNTASPARMYDFYLGGSHNFPADREAAQRALSKVPDGREIARANRDFLVRVVKYLARNGIDQFIDIGSGIPTSPNVHEAARAIKPCARVAYIDNDPDVVMHTRDMLSGLDGVNAIYGDIRYPVNVAYAPALLDVIDFSRPVAALFVAVLHFLTNGDDPYNSVSVLTQRMMSGSYIAISHITSDGTDPDTIRTIQEAYEAASAPAIFRTRRQIEDLFHRLELVRPGLVEISEWRSNNRKRAMPPALRFIGAIGRKP
jgi:S-adenosyl methyltransferase